MKINPSHRTHILQIICLNTRDKSAEYIHLNGYAPSLKKAYEIYDYFNGGIREGNKTRKEKDL